MAVRELEKIKSLITNKLKGRMTRKEVSIEMVSKTDTSYPIEAYEYVLELMIKHGEIIEQDGFVRLKSTGDYTKLFTEEDGQKGLWVTKL